MKQSTYDFYTKVFMKSSAMKKEVFASVGVLLDQAQVENEPSQESVRRYE